MRKPRARISDRAHKSEAEISDLHMSTFKADGSAGATFLLGLCRGQSLTRQSLIVLAKVFSIISGVHFPRDFTRRRDLIFKWFTDHISELEPFGPLFTLELISMEAREGDEPERAFPALLAAVSGGKQSKSAVC